MRQSRQFLSNENFGNSAKFFAVFALRSTACLSFLVAEREKFELAVRQSATNVGDVPIAVELRRGQRCRNECYAALVTWATGLIVMRSW